MVEVHVNVVGLQAAQASFERGHYRSAAVVRARHRLRGQEDLVALALERVADRGLGFAVAVSIGRVEVVDPAIVGVAHEVFLPGSQAARAERDVGNPETGAAKRRVAADARRRFERCARAAGQRQDRYAHAGQHTAFQELASSHDRSSVRSFHLRTSRSRGRGVRGQRQFYRQDSPDSMLEGQSRGRRRYSSCENRSHAACLLTPKASPIRVQVTSRLRRAETC